MAEKAALDAGLRPHDHYKIRLPKSRYSLRHKLLPIIRWETPYLAKIQETVRSDILDTYFAYSANLGTHTFFMMFLPLCFWFGHTEIGRSLVHMLALGVFWSGFIKDLVCLPRPLSPPLHRITMSGSAALEYGFPSTHSTNAVSVAIYILFAINNNPALTSRERITYIVCACLYAISIIIGRIYCGMHGFFDVVVGSTLGVAIAMLEWYVGPSTNQWVWYGTWAAPAIMTLVILICVRIHPEPADPCPCFDDGVAFAGVIVGVEWGHWHYSNTSYSWDTPVPATVPYTLESVGWPFSILRLVMGIAIIFLWREIAKSVLLKYLPPLFRFIGRIGLALPRRHFIDAKDYKSVPSHLPDETIPPIRTLPKMIRRGRSDSVGPQSAADAYETLAFRERKRRESLGQEGAPVSPVGFSNDSAAAGAVNGGVNGSSDFTDRKREAPTSNPSGGADEENPSDETYYQQEREMLSMIEKPRVRYDVEVVTKLMVYSGIAWWSVEGIPILFELVGLGAGLLASTK